MVLRLRQMGEPTEMTMLMSDSRERLVEVPANRPHLVLHRLREGDFTVVTRIPGTGERFGNALDDLLEFRYQGERRVRLVLYRLAEELDTMISVFASERVLAVELYRVTGRYYV